MKYELVLPTRDFFSYQWYERSGFDLTVLIDGLYSRVDSTRRKLNKLEAKLSKRLRDGKYNPDLLVFWDRVVWLTSHIGIWATAESWVVQQVYPNSKQVMSQWPEDLFGKWKEGNVLILLSPSTVHWLNAVDRWISELTVTSTTL